MVVWFLRASAGRRRKILKDPLKTPVPRRRRAGMMPGMNPMPMQQVSWLIHAFPSSVDALQYCRFSPSAEERTENF